MFPRRTTLTPVDALAFVGFPPLDYPDPRLVSEVHVSVTWSWDTQPATGEATPLAERLFHAWSQYYPVVKLGGPAYGSPTPDFTPGLYVADGAVFTSRGCDNSCEWCLVPGIEGPLRLLTVADGWNILDNNLLQTSREHQVAVYAMLKRQKHAAVFSGGLDARLVDDWVAGQLAQLRIEQLFLAADTDAALDALRDAVAKLAFLGRSKLRCFVLIGRESLAQARRRLDAVWDAGAMPFAMLYQPPSEWIEYSIEWRQLRRAFSRPATTKAVMRDRTAAIRWG